jgi:hypothetical protein
VFANLFLHFFPHGAWLLEKNVRPGAVAHTYKPSCLGDEDREDQDQLGWVGEDKVSETPTSINMLGMV